MIVVFNATTALFGIKRGYFIGFLFYWIFCAAIITLIFKRQNRKLIDILKLNLKSKKALIF